MRRTSALAVAALFGWFSMAFAEEPRKTEKEVHLVSIYEGYEETGNQIHGPRAKVHVDRPGKDVTLVLTSHSGATWFISKSEETKLRQVILGGHEQQAIEGLPEGTKVVNPSPRTEQSVGYLGYQRGGVGFQRALKRLFAITGMELSSYSGGYRPSAEKPFLINQVQDDQQLLTSYPQPTPLDQLPVDARDLKFKAHHYVSSDHFHQSSSYGDFTLTGPVLSTLKPLPDRVSRIAYDPETKTYCGITGHEICVVDMVGKTAKELKMGLNVPRLSWPCEIAFDTQRKRFVLGSSGGGGYLYGYSPEKDEWSVISKRPGLDSFNYSDTDDLIYGVIPSHGDYGNKYYLGIANAEGALVSKFALGSPIEPGCLTNGPGVCTTQVIPLGKYVVILCSPGGLGDRGQIDAETIYLIELASKKVWLTWKDQASN